MLWTTLVCAALAQGAANPPPANAADATATVPAVQTRAVPALPTIDAAAPVDAPGLHNVVAFAPDVLSGSVPEGDAGFDSLKAWGVRMIISVDGAVPDLERAKARGIRYVHLPIGYHGFDEARKLELARAVHDLPRPVYIHCHHGKHRSAGAAGTIAVTLGWMTPDQAVSRMKVAGTAPSYSGLYRCAAESVKVADAAISGARADFPEVSRPAGLVKGMVDIDLTWDNLKAVQKAGWTVPSDHPDVVPAAEAGRLADTLRLLCDDTTVKAKPTEFQAMMARSAQQAQSLEDLLAKLVAGARPSPEDAERLNAIASQIAATCKACHTAYRD